MHWLSILFLSLLFYQPIDYKTVFSNNYENAVKVISDNACSFFQYSEIFGTNSEVITSVVFPESIRYSIIKDFIETKSLELSYVYSGDADFSIGPFQMKPSFIEEIEDQILSNPGKLGKYDFLLISGKKSEVEIRRERIERLKSLEYQIIYANCLYDIIKILYPVIFDWDVEDQIRFISTAFNHGFLSGYDEICSYSNKQFFPFSGRKKTAKYNYCDISVYFYQNEIDKIVLLNN